MNIFIVYRVELGGRMWLIKMYEMHDKKARTAMKGVKTEQLLILKLK